MSGNQAKHTQPEWVDSAIFWHVYPLGFTGCDIRGNTAPAPRLRQLLNWLDYLVELGCNGLLLGPIFASRTHGYDTIDHFQIDPRLGGEQDFDDLVEACHQRGIRLVLDGVFSHVADGFVRPELIDDSQVFEGHADLLRLRHGDPAVAQYVTEVMNHWLERGADGWRLDAAYSVAPEFWRRVLDPVKEQHPGAYILGEVIHGDYPEIVTTSGFDSLTQYELWKAIWSAINDRNFFELDWNLKRHGEFLDSFIPQTFIGNHDVTRIATQVGREGGLLALAILMTVGGVPSLYYGDEIGMTGLKEERLGGDDAIRPAYPQTPTELKRDASRWDASAEKIFNAYRGLIALRRQNPWLVRARTEVIDLENEAFTYRVYGLEAGQELTVELSNCADKPVGVKISRGENVLWGM